MSDTHDVEALVARLENLADCDTRAGEPLGKCMREAATALRTLARERDEQEAREFTSDSIVAEERQARFAAEAERDAALAQLAGAKEALEQAEQRFEKIRETLVNHLEEPERSAFWTAVSGRDELRRARAVYEALASAPASAGVGVNVGQDAAKLIAKLIWNRWSYRHGGSYEGASGTIARADVDECAHNIVCALTPSEGRDGKEVRS